MKPTAGVTIGMTNRRKGSEMYDKNGMPYDSDWEWKALEQRAPMDEAIAEGIVDEYGCHKKCGEYFYDCKCEGVRK